ncbi:Hypothetical protein GbCGDNIH9_7029 [Granulibacter bethesdensis]|uniref:Uncharacterized protein n=1 Tax=Granulibacter bethesdensis TaxID=364410 RepID=A0AAC9KB84_9PROT|nr:Hypothetical protein GbCGDNIH9_7029 [Granulibacter bethesdensis]APH62799.1 Hypothetical protein GbCGDNIH8_8672 [Granulibacter bethesdensis]
MVVSSAWALAGMHVLTAPSPSIAVKERLMVRFMEATILKLQF